MLKKKLFLLLRVLVSFSMIGMLIWMMRDQLDKIGKTIITADVKFIVLAFLIFLCSVFIMGLRLRNTLKVQLIRLSVKEAVFLCFLGYFFNNFLPTSIGGDVVKAYYAGKISNRKSAAFSGVVMDRLLAMLPFTFIPACALFFVYNIIDDKVIISGVLIIFALTVSTLVFLLNKNLARKLKFLLKPFKDKPFYEKMVTIYHQLNLYWHHKRNLVRTILLSLSGQILFVFSVYVISKSVGVDNVPLGVFFLLVPIIGVIGMIPSINGLGVREAGIVYMFRNFIPADTAFAVSLLVLGMLFGLSIVGGVIYAFMRDIYNFKGEKEQ